MKKQNQKIWDGYKKEEKILIMSVFDKYRKFVKTGMIQSTNFLNPREFDVVIKALKHEKIFYHVVDLHEECENRVITFGGDNSVVTIYRGVFEKPITHSDVLGTLFSIGYEREMIGDIFVEGDLFYFTNLTRLNSFLEQNFYQIKNQSIVLEKVEKISFKRNRYHSFSLIVSSRRIDHIVGLLSKKSRKDSLDFLKRGNVFLNYQEVTDGVIRLKDGDILSIRHVGKFRLIRGVKNTRKQKEVVEIWKYL